MNPLCEACKESNKTCECCELFEPLNDKSLRDFLMSSVNQMIKFGASTMISTMTNEFEFSRFNIKIIIEKKPKKSKGK